MLQPFRILMVVMSSDQHDQSVSCMQLALLFLTRGPMPLEPVWREFLSAAALLEPNPDVRLIC